MKKTLKLPKPMTAEAIAQLADKGKSVLQFSKGEGRMVQPIQRISLDRTTGV